MAYIFDTNIFIRSKNEMPFDLWPTFWTRVAEMIVAKQVFSNEAVKAEIERGNDELTAWMASHVVEGFYISNDAGVMQKYSEVLNWAQACPHFQSEAIATFAEVADAFLVATAAAKGYTLVTNETSDPRCRRRVKIPDACSAFGVRCCGLNDVLSELGLQI